MRLNRSARIAAAAVLAALSLSGCANKDVLQGSSHDTTHTVRMTVSSNVFAAALTYRVGHGKSVDVSKPVGCLTNTQSGVSTSSNVTSTGTLTATDACAGFQNQLRFSSITLHVRSGVHVSMTGGAPVTNVGTPLGASGSGALPSTDTFTCSILVDGVPRARSAAVEPLGAPVPTCSAQGYVGDRPFQVTRLLEYIAVGICLLVIIIGFGITLTPERHRT